MSGLRGALAVGLLLAGSTACRAHELKVLASRLVARPGDRDTVYVCWGHVLPVDAPINRAVGTPAGRHRAREATAPRVSI